MKGQFVPCDTWTILDVFSVDNAAEKKGTVPHAVLAEDFMQSPTCVVY